MDNSTSIALSSQLALQRQMDVIANNIANLSTPAYKGEEMLFTEYLARVPGGAPLSFVQDAGTARNMRQGPLAKTDNPLDIALQGNGYLEVQTPDGTRYTRNGHLALDSQGELVTTEGDQVLNAANQPIIVPPDAGSVTISQDGTVSTNRGVIAQIPVVDFANPEAMAVAAGGLYVTDQTPQPATNTKIVQGMIEQSNIQPVLEMTRLMAAARAVGAARDFVNGQATLQQNAIDKLGKTI
jgi:flagellar basal-body rod protein FlgF